MHLVLTSFILLATSTHLSMSQDVMLDSKMRISHHSVRYMRHVNITLTVAQLREMQAINNLYDELAAISNEVVMRSMGQQCAKDLRTVLQDMNAGVRYAIKSK